MTRLAAAMTRLAAATSGREIPDVAERLLAVPKIRPVVPVGRFELLLVSVLHTVRLESGEGLLPFLRRDRTGERRVLLALRHAVDRVVLRHQGDGDARRERLRDPRQ